MPTPRQQLIKIQAWSYSRFQTYDACPEKAKHLYIEKKKEPDSPAGVKGTRVHAIAAMIASGKLPPRDKDNEAFYHELKPLLEAKKLPVELETFKQEFKALRKQKPLVESEWAFNREWEPTGWFDADCWLRIKVDLHYLVVKKTGVLRSTAVHIIDHKTGKEHEDHKLQRSLYALGAFLVYPDAEVVHCAHWYLDAGVESPPQSWKRGQLEALKKEWLKRTEAMLNDTTYAPNPGQHCRWCHFSKAKGGPCQF